MPDQDTLHAGRYQHSRPLTAEEYDALKADIQAHGVLESVHVDDAGEILSGHHRAKIANELGISFPTTTHAGLSELEKHERAVSLESLGRANDMETKRWTAHHLYHAPDLPLSQKRIAELVGVSPQTMVAWVKAWNAAEQDAQTVATSEIQVLNFTPPGPERVENVRGQQRPRTYQPRQPKPKPTPAPDPIDAGRPEPSPDPDAGPSDWQARAEERRKHSPRWWVLQALFQVANLDTSASADPLPQLANASADEIAEVLRTCDAVAAWTDAVRGLAEQTLTELQARPAAVEPPEATDGSEGEADTQDAEEATSVDSEPVIEAVSGEVIEPRDNDGAKRTIAEWLKYRGLTREQVSQRTRRLMNYSVPMPELGISEERIERFERGETRPTPKQLETLGRVLDCQPEQITRVRKLWRGNVVDESVLREGLDAVEKRAAGTPESDR